MKYLSREKIAGFLDRLKGEDSGPTKTDRALGIGVLGASSVLELAGSGAISKYLGNPPVEGLQDSPQLSDAVVKNMQDAQDATHSIRPVGPPGYNKETHSVLNPPGTPEHIKLHELGHSTNRDKRSVRALGNLNLGSHATPVAGLLAGIGLAGTGNETLETIAPAAVAAIHAPNLIEESRAWLNANKALKATMDAQDTPDATQVAKSFRNRGLASLGGYGLAAGSNIVGAYKLPAIIDKISER